MFAQLPLLENIRHNSGSPVAATPPTPTPTVSKASGPFSEPGEEILDRLPPSVTETRVVAEHKARSREAHKGWDLSGHLTSPLAPFGGVTRPSGVLVSR